ncbi:MAG TPA: TrkA C-terminal domain-containing protein [Candidatus Limnocylindrales bacterium]|nr:TrkA C-terminal domain-containing protein [Candidatus Limnocylindrales bacterium]
MIVVVKRQNLGYEIRINHGKMWLKETKGESVGMSTEIALLVLVFLLIFVGIEMATVMFKLTGLERDKARFEAISIISANGYTTIESELVTKHPVRRKIAMGLMISGPIVLAVIISLLVRILTADIGGVSDLLFLSGILVIIYILVRNPRFILFFERYLEKNIEKTQTFCHLGAGSIENFGEYMVTEVVLTNSRASLANKTLKELQLQDCGIIVLSINRKGNVIYVPRGDDRLLPGDILLLFGQPGRIKSYVEPDV